MSVPMDEVRAAVADVERPDPAAVHERIRALARPRRSGSPGARVVETELRRRLERLGYEVRELPFEFSTWPGRFGVPLLGVAALAGSALAARALVAGRAPAALLALLAVAALFGAAVRWHPAAIRSLPLARCRTSNWLACRPGSRPSYLIAAHRDSKSQPLSTVWRTAAVLATAAGWLGLCVVCAGALLADATLPAAGTAALAAVAGLGSLGLASSGAGNRSPGALDNASGLAALLTLAERCVDAADVGFLVTDGEELILAGAHAVAGCLPPVRGVVNLDGLDDGGTVRILDRHGWPPRESAPELAGALLATARALDVPAATTAVPVGILVDHTPLADAGLPALSVTRGTVKTLARVHRPADTADALTGSGAADVVAVVDGALRLLRGRRPGDGPVP